VGSVVLAEEAATPQEVALAVADGAESLRGWLTTTYPDYWARIELGRKIELGRISRNPYDQYTGRLRDETLIGKAAEFLNPRRMWSATQLGEYGTCGFRFFARRLLKLEALKEPEDGMDIMQLGTLNHEILEATYTALAEQGAPITPEYADLRWRSAEKYHLFMLPRRGIRASSPGTGKSGAAQAFETFVRLDFSGRARLKALPHHRATPIASRSSSARRMGLAFSWVGNWCGLQARSTGWTGRETAPSSLTTRRVRAKSQPTRSGAGAISR
jgi:hypothetical protein